MRGVSGATLANIGTVRLTSPSPRCDREGDGREPSELGDDIHIAHPFLNPWLIGAHSSAAILLGMGSPEVTPHRSPRTLRWRSGGPAQHRVHGLIPSTQPLDTDCL
jgi:hypothetical protein